MSINPTGAAAAALSVFGGLVTEMSPPDLPEGVSPDNQDVVFVPGSVASRPGLHAQLSPPFPSSGLSPLPSVEYAKSYVMPNGQIVNLYLDSNGKFWVEALTTPGVYVALGAVTTPGLKAKSITAFGREYIAISDGLHGQDVPIQYDGTNIDRVTQDGPGACATVANLIIPAVALAGSLAGGATLIRSKNVVTAATASAHGLQVGYQAQITDVDAQAIGNINSIVIDNEDLPGLATVNVTAHGLAPGQFVTLQSINAVAVGGTISTITSNGGSAYFTMTLPHGLVPGAVVKVVNAANVIFDTVFTVSAVDGPTTFQTIWGDIGAGLTSGAGGTVTLAWPVPDTGTPNYYQVIASPTADTFQIALQFSDATFTSGAVFAPWNGTFFVASVPSATTFTYQNYGPDGISTVVGTVTPFGQVAPGQHQMQVLFLTRQDYITRPSPPVTFVANGGEYLAISNIPIGPANVVARILAFTGASGAYFFYIPVQAQVNGQIVSSATQINDNTTTALTLDFSDNTLFASLGITTPGNDLANQIVLDSALGFGFYDSRLITYGQRNVIQNLLNMGFDGGALPSASTQPTGWTGPAGSLTPIHFGVGWHAGAGTLSQSFYEDAYGAPIGTPNTQYTARAWLHGSGSLTVTISSVSTGFSTSAILIANFVRDQFTQADFSAAMPATIPSDMLLTISGPNSLIADDLSVIYTANPYLDTILYGSYVDNPEAFDGVSGKFGPSQDTRKVMDFGIVRETMYVVTQDPSGKIHAISANGVTEPSGWTVTEVAANCGLLSTFALCHSQADDTSAGGGEEWFAWASSSGARIFWGDQPQKISQEIQPNWTGDVTRGFSGINFSAATTIWALNDPVARVIYLGIPSLDIPGQLTAPNAPNLMLVMNYRELDTPASIANSPAFHPSFSGHLIATDNTRKWTRWNLSTNGGVMMYRMQQGLGIPASLSPGPLSFVLLSGDGGHPLATGHGNVYTLDPAKLTDDDYGIIVPYYVTYFFVGHDLEQALKCEDAKGNMVALGGGRKLFSYISSFISGVGQVELTFFPNSLSNPWSLTVTRALVADPKHDLECGGGSCVGRRIAVKFASMPIPASPPTTDNGFNIQKVVVWLKRAERLQIRGAAQ